MELPYCCIGCRYIYCEQEDYKPAIYFCSLNIFLPFKKQTCKKRIDNMKYKHKKTEE